MEQNRESINLNKYISSTGICSRREAEKFIEQGRVTINGQKTQLGNRVFEGDVVKIDGKPLRAKPRTIYIALNKPIGVVCTTDSKEQNNIVNFVGHSQRLFPIGRLDKPSEGLIFLTNDGDIVNKILRAGNNHEKEYIVTVDKPINDRFIQRMANGIPILGTVTKKCKVEKISDRVFKIILIQGLNRQIRRMCEYLGYEVQRLKRVRIMNVSLDRLKTGEWRELTSKEMAEINKLVATSKKTSDIIDKVSHKNVTPRSAANKSTSNKNTPSKNKTFRKAQNTEKRFKPKFSRTKNK